MKLYNSTASNLSALQYPPDITVTANLPRTKADVESFTSKYVRVNVNAANTSSLPANQPQAVTVVLG